MLPFNLQSLTHRISPAWPFGILAAFCASPAGWVLTHLTLILAAFSVSGLLLAQKAPTTVPAAGPGLKAAASLTDVPEVKPGMTHDALIALAEKATQDGQFQRAGKILQAVFEEDPANFKARSHLAYVYERLATVAKDASDATAVKQLEDMAVGHYLAMAGTLHDLGNDDKAEQMYNKVFLYRSNEPAAQLGMARVLAATERPVLAIERYKDYLKNPGAPSGTFSQANLELGRAFRKSKFFAQAIDRLKTAEGLNPENPEIYMEEAKTYQDMGPGSMDKARQAAEMALRKSPGNPEYQNILAGILLAQNVLDQARVEARNAVEGMRQKLRAKPDDQAALQSLNAYYRTYGQVLRSILNKEPENITARIDLAQVMQEQSDVDHTLNMYDVLQVLSNASPQGQNNVRLLESLARVQRDVYQLTEAEDTCRRILKIDPKNETAAQILQGLPDALKNPPTTQPGQAVPSRTP